MVGTEPTENRNAPAAHHHLEVAAEHHDQAEALAIADGRITAGCRSDSVASAARRAILFEQSAVILRSEIAASLAALSHAIDADLPASANRWRCNRTEVNVTQRYFLDRADKPLRFRFRLLRANLDLKLRSLQVSGYREAASRPWSLRELQARAG